jgi:hypothetical protein
MLILISSEFLSERKTQHLHEFSVLMPMPMPMKIPMKIKKQ